MRIVCISDTHGLHRKLSVPLGDVLIHAGDFSSCTAQLDVIDEFNDWLGNLPHAHKVVVAGNHDLLFESSPLQARERLSNAIYLESSGATIDGFHFWGCPVTPVLRKMAFSVQRGAESSGFWKKMPVNTDVLITHGPPFGILDKQDILASHDGCDQLIKAVLRVKPMLHVFGHIHGGYGVEEGPHGTQFVNSAVLNGSQLREPIVVDLEGLQQLPKGRP